jgi:hypothetical protein
MSNDAKVDLDQYQKDKEEFDEATDFVLAADSEKTDEEILADMDKKKEDNKGEAGEATQDPDKSKSDDPAAADPALFGVSPEKVGDKIPAIPEVTDPEKKPDEGTDATDWKDESAKLKTELATEKQKTSSWNGRITAANKRAEDAEAKLEEALKEAKPVDDPDAIKGTESEMAKLEKFGVDFPELKSTIDIILKKVEGKADKTQDKDPLKTDPIEEKPDEKAGDLKAAQSEIRAAHPDLDEAVNSGVLLTWINQQATFIQPTLQAIYSEGKPADVIKMVTEFKNKTGWKSQLATDTPKADTSKEDKLKNMIETNSGSGGPPAGEPDKNDFDGAAKEAFG